MHYRALGKSGLKVSEIGLGGVSFGLWAGQQESAAVIDRALNLGVNFIDTANIYGAGRSEECVGKAIKGKRTGVIIATKFGLPAGPGPNEYGCSRYHIMQAIDASLKRLGTDYIDLYYVHWPDPTTPIEETLRTLNDLVQAGKVRYIGCSNFSAWQLCESLWISKVNNLESFVAVQSRYNYLDRSIESELVPCCQAYGVGIIPWAPLADGFLTGKYQRGKPTPTGSRLSITPPSMKISPFYSPVPEFVSHLTDTNYDKLETLQKFAASHGRSVGELAIAWLLSHSTVSSVIAGATNPAQISANITGIDWRLTEQEMAQLG